GSDVCSSDLRVERMIGVSSSIQNRPSNPDGEYLPPFNLRCLDHILQKGAEKIGVPYLPDRIAQLTVDHAGHPACHFCGACTTGCDRSEERRVGKNVDLGGRRIGKKK